MPSITIHSTQHDQPFGAPRVRAKAVAVRPDRSTPTLSGVKRAQRKVGRPIRPTRFAESDLPPGTVVMAQRREPMVFVVARMVPGDAWLLRTASGYPRGTVATAVHAVNQVRRAEGVRLFVSYESRGCEVLIRCLAIEPTEGSAA